MPPNTQWNRIASHSPTETVPCKNSTLPSPANSTPAVKECLTLGKENERLESELAALKTKLEKEKQSVGRLGLLLQETKSELAETKSVYREMSVSMEHAEKSKTELRDTNMKLQEKLEDALQDKMIAEHDAVAAHEAAREQVDRIEKEVAEEMSKMRGQLEMAIETCKASPLSARCGSRPWRCSKRISGPSMISGSDSLKGSSSFIATERMG